MTQTELYEVAMEPIVLTAKQEEVIKRSRSNRKKKDNNLMMKGSVDKADSISHATCGSTKSYPKLCRHRQAQPTDTSLEFNEVIESRRDFRCELQLFYIKIRYKN